MLREIVNPSLHVIENPDLSAAAAPGVGSGAIPGVIDNPPLVGETSVGPGTGALSAPAGIVNPPLTPPMGAGLTPSKAQDERPPMLVPGAVAEIENPPLE